PGRAGGAPADGGGDAEPRLDQGRSRLSVVVGQARFAFARLAAKRFDVACQHRPDAVLPLHEAIDHQNRVLVGDLPVAVVDVRLEGDVYVAELVLEREEADL